jgi:TonB family protein
MKNRRSDIERYLRGELTAAEMHALENEALNDPFLAEALEGVEQAGADNFLYDLHALNRSLHDRTRKRKSKTIRMWGWTTGIAATVLLVAVSGFLVVNLIRQQNDRQLALQQKSGDKLAEGASRDTVATALEMEPAPAPVENHAYNTDAPRRERAAREEQRPVEKADDASQLSRADSRATPDETLSAKEEEKNTAATLERDVTSDLPSPIAGATEKEETKIAARQSADGASREKAAEENEPAKRRRESKDKAASRPAAALAVQPEPASLTGRVLSAEDGEALPGVTVMVKGTSVAAVTDVNGDYRINVPSLDSSLLVSFVGFETKEIDVRGQQHVEVRLKEDVSQLNEVVVTGYGNPANQTVDEANAFRVAEPQGGRTAFKNYIVQSLKYPDEAVSGKIEGKVTVRFTVQPDGGLTDFEVLKGIGSGCDEELIRLIKNGPIWRPATQGAAPVADKVKVRFRFELPR